MTGDPFLVDLRPTGETECRTPETGTQWDLVRRQWGLESGCRRRRDRRHGGRGEPLDWFSEGTRDDRALTSGVGSRTVGFDTSESWTVETVTPPVSGYVVKPGRSDLVGGGEDRKHARRRRWTLREKIEVTVPLRMSREFRVNSKM